MTKFIVKADRQKNARCAFAQYQIAVIEMDDTIATRVPRISATAKGVTRIVHYWNHQRDEPGKSSGYRLTLCRAEALANALNAMGRALGAISVDWERALKLAILNQSIEELERLRFVKTVGDHGLRYGQPKRRQGKCAFIARIPQRNGRRASQIWADWSPESKADLVRLTLGD